MARKNSLKVLSYETYPDEKEYVSPEKKVDKATLDLMRKIGSASIFGL